MAQQPSVVRWLPASERDIFALVQRGDQEAFRALFRLHQRPVYLTAYSVVRSRTDAEEITQDSFLTMWRKRAKISLVGDSALPWLVTTARFLGLNRRRANARSARESLDAAGTLADASNSPVAGVLAAELVEQLGSLMSGMSDVDRDIFRLCLLDELSYEQEAREMGITHGAVRNRLSRLKGRLRLALDDSKEGQN